MSYTIECNSCGQPFTKFSIKSRENRCFDCRSNKKSVNKYVNLKNQRANQAAEVLERIDTLEQDIASLTNSVNALHDAIDVAVCSQLESVIGSAIDEHYSSITKALATVNTRSKQAFEIATTLHDTVKKTTASQKKGYAKGKRESERRKVRSSDYETMMISLYDWLSSDTVYANKYNYFGRKFVIENSDSPWYNIYPHVATNLLSSMVVRGLLVTNGMNKRGRRYKLPEHANLEE